MSNGKKYKNSRLPISNLPIAKQLRNPSDLLCGFASVSKSQFRRQFNSKQINARGHHSFFSFCCSIAAGAQSFSKGGVSGPSGEERRVLITEHPELQCLIKPMQLATKGKVKEAESCTSVGLES